MHSFMKKRIPKKEHYYTVVKLQGKKVGYNIILKTFDDVIQEKCGKPKFV